MTPRDDLRALAEQLDRAASDLTAAVAGWRNVPIAMQQKQMALVNLLKEASRALAAAQETPQDPMDHPSVEELAAASRHDEAKRKAAQQTPAARPACTCQIDAHDFNCQLHGEPGAPTR